MFAAPVKRATLEPLPSEALQRFVQQQQPPAAPSSVPYFAPRDAAQQQQSHDYSASSQYYSGGYAASAPVFVPLPQSLPVLGANSASMNFEMASATRNVGELRQHIASVDAKLDRLLQQGAGGGYSPGPTSTSPYHHQHQQHQHQTATSSSYVSNNNVISTSVIGSSSYYPPQPQYAAPQASAVRYVSPTRPGGASPYYHHGNSNALLLQSQQNNISSFSSGVHDTSAVYHARQVLPQQSSLSIGGGVASQYHQTYPRGTIEPSSFDPRSSEVLDDAMANHFAWLRLRNALQDVSDEEHRLRLTMEDEQTGRAHTFSNIQKELNANIEEELRLTRLKMLDAEELLRRHYERLAAGEEKRRVHINEVRLDHERSVGEVRRASTVMSNASMSRSRFINNNSTTSMMTTTTNTSYLHQQHLSGISPLLPARPQSAAAGVAAAPSGFFSPNFSAAGARSSDRSNAAVATTSWRSSSLEGRGGGGPSAAASGSGGAGDMSLLHASNLPEGEAQQSRRRFKTALMNEALSKPL